MREKGEWMDSIGHRGLIGALHEEHEVAKENSGSRGIGSREDWDERDGEVDGPSWAWQSDENSSMSSTRLPR